MDSRSSCSLQKNKSPLQIEPIGRQLSAITSRNRRNAFPHIFHYIPRPCSNERTKVTVGTKSSSSMNRPNILFILSDQHSKFHLGCYGDPLVRTPHLDRLASEGMRFANAYTPSPLCAPARMAFMTGRRPSANQVWGQRPHPQLGAADLGPCRGRGRIRDRADWPHALCRPPTSATVLGADLSASTPPDIRVRPDRAGHCSRPFPPAPRARPANASK